MTIALAIEVLPGDPESMNFSSNQNQNRTCTMFFKYLTSYYFEGDERGNNAFEIGLRRASGTFETVQQMSRRCPDYRTHRELAGGSDVYFANTDVVCAYEEDQVRRRLERLLQHLNRIKVIQCTSLSSSGQKSSSFLRSLLRRSSSDFRRNFEKKATSLGQELRFSND